MGAQSPVLSVRNAQKRFGPVQALVDVSLEAYRGEVLALLGDNGALSANVNIFNRVATNQPRTIGVDLNFKY